MARVVDYADVLRQAETLGLRCVYYNTGAFGFQADAAVHIIGWLGADDPSIRPDLLAGAVRVPPPYPRSLVERLGRVWPAVVDGEAWVMPKSHWAFELDHGNGPWLAPALRAVGVDPEPLRLRTDGSAIAFAAADPAGLAFVETLLTNLRASDYAILFPRHQVLVTVHHHQQLWWEIENDQWIGVITNIG